MKILHYTLGFSPNRSGGLVGYATDLMKEQQKSGHDVSALYPGELNLLSKKTTIKQGIVEGMKTYQLVNSLPLPLFGGIKSPKDFMQPLRNKNLYINFLNVISPDVIHVHTLMGIHKEFFEAAKDLKIKIVYTSHDYFGLAPEPNFFFNDFSYDQENTVDNWIRASKDAMSTGKLRIFQLKNYAQIRKILKSVSKYLLKKDQEKLPRIQDESDKGNFNFSNKENMQILKKYYLEIFSLVSCFHFNSKLAKEVFTTNLPFVLKGEVISITTAKIKNKSKNKAKKISSKKRIAYIGPNKTFKGYDTFIEVAQMFKEDNSFEFHTYGYSVIEMIDGVIQHGRYSSEELEDIYSAIDLLVVPSKWKETFGLIVEEAISNHTQVLASKNVGSKDLLTKSMIFSDDIELVEKIKMFRNEENDANIVKTIQEHELEMANFYLK